MTRRSAGFLRSPIAAAVVGALLLMLALVVAVPRAQGGQYQPVPAAATDTLPRDPALTVGTLPNGMRYYLRVNHAPKGRASLWLAVNAGSVLEDDDQQGFAHFLEHMAFNGIRHYPKNTFIDYLERAGMRFGADINASTSFDETVYKLQVPTDDPRVLTQGLQILQDWASGGVTMDSSEVLAERGVIMGEWRSRLPDTLSLQVQAHRDSVLYGGGSPYTTRHPIGLPELLEAAEPGPIKRFYHDWYRPDLMAVVVVGDFDKAAVEREIKARFGTIPAREHPRPRVIPRLLSNATPVVDVYRGPVRPDITVLWKVPVRHVETRAAYRQQLVERLLFQGLDHRFQRLVQQDTVRKRPFFGAAVGRTQLAARTSDVYLLRVVAWPDMARGLAGALAELERAAQHGIPAATLARRKALMLHQLEHAAAEAAAIPSRSYVQAYVADYLHGGSALMSAEQELALARELLPTITARDLARAARFWRTGDGRVTMVSFPKYGHAALPTVASINAIFDSVAHLTLAPDSVTAREAASPLLATLPTPGKVVAEKRDAKAGITEWTLSNGAHVLYKPTQNDPDQLLIRAWSPGGSSLLTDSLFYSPGRLVGTVMTEAANLGREDHSGLTQQLALSGLQTFGVRLGTFDEAIDVGGSPSELETLFQVLYAQLTAPKLDSATIEWWKKFGPKRAFQRGDGITSILTHGNPRMQPPSPYSYPFVKRAKAMAVYHDRFSDASDFTFIIVGAAPAAQVKPLVERYVASLPSTRRAEPEQPRDFHVPLWKGKISRTIKAIEQPKAHTTLIFDGALPQLTAAAEMAERQRLNALGTVLRLKFTAILRERMGGTYGVGVQSQTYADPTQEHYRLSVGFDSPPERIDEMTDALFRILDTVRAGGATADELSKVAAIRRRAREVALQENAYWVNAMEAYTRRGLPLDWIAAPPEHQVTVAEVKAAARRYLSATSYIHITYLPQDSTLYAAQDSTHAPADSSQHVRAAPWEPVPVRMVHRAAPLDRGRP